MSKRLFLFWGLLGFVAVTSSSQVLTVDSIEVSIVIPEKYRKQMTFPGKPGIKEDENRMYHSLLEVDSLFPDKHFYSDGRIKIKVDHFYNQKIKPYVLEQKVWRNLILEKESDDVFDPYSIVSMWRDTIKYKPFAFSLKYTNRRYPSIIDYPSMFDSTPLEQYHHFLEHPIGADTLIATYQTSPVKMLMDKLLIQNPSLAEEVWDNIPDPPKISYGDGYIEKRSAQEEINRLLSLENLNTKNKLEKRAELKRPWSYGGTENIQFSQAFLENWVKGGENAVSLLSDLRIQAKYKKENVEWESYAIHKLGILSSDDRKTRVNDDLIELNTKYGLSAGKKWFYSGLFNFKTQFFNGYEKNDELKENPISGFLAPAYITMALGMDYKEKNFTLMLLPFTSKMTFVSDTVKFDQTRYNIPKDKKSDNMGGASLVNNFTWEFAKDFNLSSKLDFFYEYMKSDNQIQSEWELILDMKINIFLSARISTYVRYYSNESDKIQFRENLSISFNYRF
jgi:hypothetical protein